MNEVTVVAEDLAAMRHHVEGTYPEEGCGFLVGSEGSGDAVEVRSIQSAPNRSPTERHRRYVIEPSLWRSLETELERRGESIVGVFHSHPDHPAVPSEFDRDHALPGYVYLVLGVHQGRMKEVNAFELKAESREFVSIPFSVDAPVPRPSGARRDP